MAMPSHVEYLVVGAGIHGLSTAWRLAQRLTENGETVAGRVVVIDKTGIAAGASGIACGVVRNNYFQPAMRRLMAHSVDVWESDPDGLAYHPVGYMQISSESMREDVGSIYAQQQAIGYESVFIEGADASMSYMRGIFSDWQAQNITSVLHEKRGGFSNQTKTMYALADKVEKLGVRIISGVTVKGFNTESGSASIQSVETDKGAITCERVVIAAGPWARDFWAMLDLPGQITVKGLGGVVHNDVDMWRFWQLEEGVLQIDPGLGRADDGTLPPVIHVDTDAPLYSTVDGSLVTDEMWGIYYKPDWHFGGIQGGASPYKVETPWDKVQIDPYGPSSPEFVASDEFAHMWVSALAHCQKRYEGQMGKYHREASGGIGCFTADSFPVFDHFHENATVIADSNHGWKMLGVGHL
ncbi:MAG: FAD-binding oxidoreductase, partial [Amylibacter sp.]